MARIFVVDDSRTQAQQVKLMLEDAGHAVEVAANGREGFEGMDRVNPDLVLTDLHMPEMDGLQLVEAVRGKYPSVPVILMTAFGSEEIAIEALRKGASSYVPKKNLEQDLIDTVAQVLSVADAGREHQRLLECLMQTESHLILDNDPTLVPPLIGHLRDSVNRMQLCDETGIIRLTVALTEAVNNAIVHGNLEVPSGLREKDDRAYLSLIQERRGQRPYRERRVHVLTKETPTQATYVVRDEGPGFNSADLPDPTDPANLESVSGRGLFLIRTFMDKVHHNEKGNEITMVKRRDL
jgi:CheY-like chemotaxis protein/anti-sigma regulatory factor (Ser/Thr protein kinase)